MKHLILSTFISTFIFMSIAHANDTVKLEFSDTEETGTYILVTKTLSHRIFETCSESSCEELARVSFLDTDTEKQNQLKAEGLFDTEYLPEAAGVGIGLLVGSRLIKYQFETFSWDRRKSKAHKIREISILIAIFAGGGYLAGDIADNIIQGGEFSHTESAALRSTLFSNEVMDTNAYSDPVTKNITLDEYVFLIDISVNALNESDNLLRRLPVYPF